MKTPILVLVILASAAIGGLVAYSFLGAKPAPVPAVATTSASTDVTPVPAKAITETMQPAPRPAAATQPVTVIPASAVMTVNSDTNAAATAALRKKVDELLDPHITAERKHELFQELAQSGQLDQAIAELQQRAQSDPTNPEIPTTIGEAQLNEIRALRDAGTGDINQYGILAMQADQNFNAALKIDPQNYEAQLVKAISMTFWPADPTRDPQVVQTLTSLIDQQENMPANPGFAQTYLYLGNEYQKMGQLAQAQATWQLGLQKFPNNPELQQKVNGH